ncbi:MAG: tetratricopeptide repeat protein [Desulfovibrio sp.]
MKKYTVILAAVLLLCTACQPRTEFSAGDKLLKEARRAYASGFYMAAEESYQKYLEEVSESVDRFEAWQRLVDISLSVKGDNLKAAGLLEAVYLEFGNTNHKGWILLNRLGDVYAQMGQYGKALRAYENSLPMVEDDAKRIRSTRLNMVRLYRRMGSHNLAIKLLEECVASSPQKSDAKAACMYELAQEFVFTENFNKASALLEDVLGFGDLPEYDRAVAALLLSDIYEEQGKKEEAQRLLITLRGAYPNPEVIEVRLMKYKG